MSEKQTKTYRHAKLGEEVRAIGGYYTIVKEERVSWQSRELLVVVGAAHFDTSCCGAGGCGYAEVPGFVVAWQKSEGETEVELITDEKQREELAAFLRKKELVHEVRFWEAEKA